MLKMNVPRVKKIVLGLIAVLLTGFLLIYLLKLIEPSSPAQNIIISNTSDHQVTISYTTARPTKGEILISSDGKFPLLPIFTKQIFKDDGEKHLKRTGLYLTHQITVGKLDQNKIYYFRIYQDWKKKYEARFKTGATLTALNSPNPVYGRIVKIDKTPVVGALVYLWVTTEATSSGFLSTLTNTEGRWSMDLANLRTADFKSSYKVSSKSVEKVIIDSGTVRVKAETPLGQDKPWPNLILK